MHWTCTGVFQLEMVNSSCRQEQRWWYHLVHIKNRSFWNWVELRCGLKEGCTLKPSKCLFFPAKTKCSNYATRERSNRFGNKTTGMTQRWVNIQFKLRFDKLYSNCRLSVLGNTIGRGVEFSSQLWPPIKEQNSERCARMELSNMLFFLHWFVLEWCEINLSIFALQWTVSWSYWNSITWAVLRPGNDDLKWVLCALLL